MPGISAMTPEEIRQRIREKLASEELPRDHPHRIWAGYGTGETCAVCGLAIPPTAVEVEAHSADEKYRYYHGACYGILVEERYRLARGEPPPED